MPKLVIKLEVRLKSPEGVALPEKVAIPIAPRFAVPLRVTPCATTVTVPAPRVNPLTAKVPIPAIDQVPELSIIPVMLTLEPPGKLRRPVLVPESYGSPLPRPTADSVVVAVSVMAKSV
jgi:hypothetical protein